MKNVKGVTGVTTFIKTNKVKILFDPEMTDTTLISKAMQGMVVVEEKK